MIQCHTTHVHISKPSRSSPIRSGRARRGLGDTLRLSLTTLLLASVGSAQSDAVLRHAWSPSDDTAVGTSIERASDRLRVTIVEAGGADERLEIEAPAGRYGSFAVAVNGVLVATIDTIEPALEVDPESIDVVVADESDDAEEFREPSHHRSNVEDRWPAGFTYVFSDDLELGFDPDHGAQAVGLRFPEVPIPAGSTVLAAELRFTAYANPVAGSDGELTLIITGEASGSVAPFTDDPNERIGPNPPSFGVTGRERTDARVTWLVDEPWDEGAAYASSDVSAIVQEVVDRTDWAPGGSLAFIIEGDGAGSDFRRAYSSVGAASMRDMAPSMWVRYQPPVDTLRAHATTRVALAPGENELLVIPYETRQARGPAGEPLHLMLVRHDTVVVEAGDPGATDTMRSPPVPGADRLDSGELTGVDGRRIGSLQLTSLLNGKSVLSVRWQIAVPVDAEAWVALGTCDEHGGRLTPLNPIGGASGESETILPFGGSALRFGRFVIVLEGAAGREIACGEVEF